MFQQQRRILNRNWNNNNDEKKKSINLWSILIIVSKILQSVLLERFNVNRMMMMTNNEMKQWILLKKNVTNIFVARILKRLCVFFAERKFFFPIQLINWIWFFLWTIATVAVFWNKTYVILAIKSWWNKKKWPVIMRQNEKILSLSDIDDFWSFQQKCHDN